MKQEKPLSLRLDGIAAPCAIESEKSLLGAILSDPDAILPEVSVILKWDDLFNPAHQTLYRAMVAMFDGGTAVEPSTLLQYLDDRKLTDAVGGASILGELCVGVVSALTWRSHAKIIADKAMLRRLLITCQQAVAGIVEREFEPDVIAREVMQSLENVSTESRGVATVPIKDVVLSTVESKIAMQSSKTTMLGIGTGWRHLDWLTSGMCKGDVWVVAARPGVGKTAFAINLAGNVAKRGVPVGFIPLEMTREQLVDRLISHEARISYSTVRDARFNEVSEIENLYFEWTEEIAKWPIHFSQRFTLSIHEIKPLIRKMVKAQGCRVVIVDYIQLIEGEKGGRNRVEELTEISRKLKVVAMEFQIVIVAVAQLKRLEDGQEPQIHHIKECGAIEQDASTILLLHQPEAGNSRNSKVKVAKSRFSQTAPINFEFDGRTQSWIECEKQGGS